jgi:hypothetical protein
MPDPLFCYMESFSTLHSYNNGYWTIQNTLGELFFGVDKAKIY